MPIRHTACRICAGQCGLEVDVDADGRLGQIRGDRQDPMSRGFACIKGLTLNEAHNSEERLLYPLRRAADGSFSRVTLDAALDEIATRLAETVERHGADSVAAFKGTMNYTNFLDNAMLPAFLRAVGSSAFYSTMTIDQSAKWVTVERLGVWGAGKDNFDEADVLMMIGTNPLVSLSTFNFALQNPVKRMREARARGMKLIVIDPRRSETAVHADLHLQPLPGEDATLLAAIIRIVLERGWHDAEFCRDHVEGLERLRQAVEPFTPEKAAARAGVAPDELYAAAALFAEPVAEGNGLRRKRGSAASGVGPDMARHSNLAEHLVETLNAICGRFARPGDRVPNPGVIGPRRPRMAQVFAPGRSWEKEGGRAPSGFGQIFGERMTGALADDILASAPSRVRALIVAGGNPVLAMPETGRALQAFEALDLLVAIDPFMSRTARLAHFILPPRMMLERFEIGSRDYETITNFAPYAFYTPPVAEPPADAEVEEDWVLLWELARRMGHAIVLDGEPLPTDRRPSSEELIGLMLRGSAVPFDEIKRETRGRLFPVAPMTVEAGAGGTDRFAVCPADVGAELQGLAGEPEDSAGPGGLRLTCRRARTVQNTMYHHLPTIRARMPANAACVNPDELERLGVADGAEVVIRSDHGEVRAIVRADATLRPGVVTLEHGWDEGNSAGAAGKGANVNRLTSSQGRDPINAMPVMTGFTVSVTPAD